MGSMRALSVIRVFVTSTGLAWAFMAGALAAGPSSAAMLPVEVEVEQGNGTVTAGRLIRIDAEGVHLSGGSGGDGGPVTLPGDGVRAVRRAVRKAGVPGGGSRLVVTFIDGTTLSGDDFEWDGRDSAALLRPEGRIELPAGRVRSLAWLADAAAGVEAAGRWQESIPEGAEKDLVVVGTAESHEFVECAILGISADAVTVQLEEETIPVKRAKVIGLHWLRGETPVGADAAGRVRVAVTGGSLRAARVEWSEGGLIVDGDVRLPAEMLDGIDYAAGRLVPLGSLTAEKIDVEPWFGGLVRHDDRQDAFASYFAPRPIHVKNVIKTAAQAAAAGTAKSVDAGIASTGVIMRPRTVAVWRLPADSRRFRAVVEAAAGLQSVDATVVSVSVDGREAVRRTVGGGGEQVVGPIDVDLTSGRRLTVTVDFGPAGGIGGAVLLIDPVIER